MIENIHQHKIQITLIFAVFILYFLNGLGAIDINLRSGFSVNFNFELLGTVFSSTAQNPLQLQSLTLVFMLVTGITLSVLLPLLTPIVAGIVTVLFCIPYIYLIAVNSSLLLIPGEYGLLTNIILFSVNGLSIYFIETHTRQNIVRIFGQYVPPEVVSRISKQPELLSMESESRRLTVFFSDMQNFSNVAEQLNPRQLSMLLNEYFNEMTEILYRHGATIDKYIGDSIMTFWGAPLKQEDHARRAVLSALEMQSAIQKLSKRFINKGWPGPVMGIGINTGMMNVGNMGSKYRIAYTVIGDAVNLASRIEALTRDYTVPILVSEATKTECPDIAFREIDTVRVKGKHNRATLYEPLCLKSDLTALMSARLKLHEEAMELYKQRDLESVGKIFTQLHEADRNDGLYPVMLENISTR